jgi:large subunit ribosomal protein L14
MLVSAMRLAASAPAAAQSLGEAARRHMSIHRMTRLRVADNSGAKEIQCIGHDRNKAPGRLGDAIRAVVKSAKSGGRVSKKDIVAAVIVRMKGRHTRADGTEVRFQENAAVLMKRDLSGPIGTRVLGPVARELRAGRFMKLVMMASRSV